MPPIDPPPPRLASHIRPLQSQVLELVVSPDPGGVFVDGTFGRGGHSRGILSALSPTGKLHGLDMDPAAVEVGSCMGPGIAVVPAYPRVLKMMILSNWSAISIRRSGRLWRMRISGFRSMPPCLGT